MSFQKKYYYTFKDLKNAQYTVEIWQDTTNTITAEEIRGDLNPFLIQYSDVTKFDVVRGSGCELNLLSTTDRKFFGLYTADMMEFQIRVYIGVNLIWLGYLDSELYSEPFNEIKNYPVRFSGTDGFAILDRINYLDSNGNKNEGLVTQWDVIKNIILKLNFNYNNINFSISTVSSQFTIGSNETIFHKTYCNNNNWYDEDGEPETCRTVLEKIFQPYGAYIIQDNGSLYIVDVNTVAKNTTTSFKKYDSSFNYVQTIDLNLNLGDISTIKFTESNQQLNVVSGFNKQLIKYSPYVESSILKLDSDNEFSSFLTYYVHGVDPYQWGESVYMASETFERHGNGTFASYQGIGKDNENETDSYLKLTKYTTDLAIPANLSYSNKHQLPLFIPSDSKLKISCKAFVRTTDNLNGQTENADIKNIKLRCRLKIGDKQYYNNVWTYQGRQTGWIDANSTDYEKCVDLDFQTQSIVIKQGYKYSEFNVIDNTWIDLKLLSQNNGGGIINKDIELKLYSDDFLIPLNSGFSGGVMSFEIYDFVANSLTNTVLDLRIKDLNLTIVDSKGNEYSKDDIEYIGYMNAKFKNEGNEISTYQGTSKTLSPIEKGSMMGFNTSYFYLNSWTREGKTDILENLLLRSIVSNYTNKTIELTATINKINSMVGCLTYQSFIPDKVFMVVACNHNLSDNTSTVTLQEISIDNLEINKVYQ